MMVWMLTEAKNSVYLHHITDRRVEQKTPNSIFTDRRFHYEISIWRRCSVLLKKLGAGGFSTFLCPYFTTLVDFHFLSLLVSIALEFHCLGIGGYDFLFLDYLTIDSDD
jgi:hypothetical protein